MPNLPDLHAIARALGGQVSQGQVLAPGPGHSAADRSMSMKVLENAPDGFVVHSFANDDVNKCRDYVREKLALPAFKPNGTRHSTDDIDKIVMAIAAAQTTEIKKVVATLRLHRRKWHAALSSHSRRAEIISAPSARWQRRMDQ